MEERSEKENEEEDIMDILGSGKLTKRVLKAGLGERPMHCQIAVMSYSMVAVANPETVLEDDEKLEFIIGDGDVMSALELSASLMNEGEEAEIRSHASYCFSDSYFKEEGCELNQSSELILRVHLKSILDPVDYETASLDSVMQICLKKKERANELYAAENYPRAIHIYSKAIKILSKDFQPQRKEDHETTYKLLVILSTNLANAQFHVGAYRACIAASDAALDLDGANVKALYRKASALLQLKENEDALSVLRRADSISPNNKLIAALTLKAKHRSHQDRKEDVKLFSKMLETEHIVATRKQERAIVFKFSYYSTNRIAFLSIFVSFLLASVFSVLVVGNASISISFFLCAIASCFVYGWFFPSPSERISEYSWFVGKLSRYLAFK